MCAILSAAADTALHVGGGLAAANSPQNPLEIPQVEEIEWNSWLYHRLRAGSNGRG